MPFGKEFIDERFRGNEKGLEISKKLTLVSFW